MEIYRVEGIESDRDETVWDKMFSDLNCAKQCFIDCVKEGNCYEVTLYKYGELDGEIIAIEMLNEGFNESYILAEIQGKLENNCNNHIYKYVGNDEEEDKYTYSEFNGRYYKRHGFNTFEEALAATNGLPIIKQYQEEW
jgi:hypothetical protein